MSQFREGYDGGRAETKKELKSLHAGRSLSDDYAYRLAKKIYILGFLFFIFGLYYFIHIHRLHWLIGVVFSIILSWVSAIILVIVSAGFIKLASKSDRYK